MPESLKLSVFIRKKSQNQFCFSHDCTPQLIVWCASPSEGSPSFCMSLDRQTDKEKGGQRRGHSNLNWEFSYLAARVNFKMFWEHPGDSHMGLLKVQGTRWPKKEITRKMLLLMLSNLEVCVERKKAYWKEPGSAALTWRSPRCCSNASKVGTSPTSSIAFISSSTVALWPTVCSQWMRTW